MTKEILLKILHITDSDKRYPIYFLSLFLSLPLLDLSLSKSKVHSLYNFEPPPVILICVVLNKGTIYMYHTMVTGERKNDNEVAIFAPCWLILGQEILFVQNIPGHFHTDTMTIYGWFYILYQAIRNPKRTKENHRQNLSP